MFQNALARFIIGTIAMVALPVLFENFFDRPRLPESSLAEVRGASYDYATTGSDSCAAIGSAEAAAINPQSFAAACDGTNDNVSCGTCSITASASYGVGASVHNGAGGQTNNNPMSCGTLKYGLCTTSPGSGQAGPPYSYCSPATIARAPNGQPYLCTALSQLGPQATQPTPPGG